MGRICAAHGIAFVLDAAQTAGHIPVDFDAFHLSALCAPGQAVSKGQVLISGYTDCGLCVLSQRAQGEVMAYTGRSFSALMPSV